MESAYVVDPDFDKLKDISLFAVWDGHGGIEVAKFCQNHFGFQLKKNAEYKKGNYEEALIQTFLTFDKMLNSSDGQAEIQKLRDGDAGES